MTATLPSWVEFDIALRWHGHVRVHGEAVGQHFAIIPDVVGQEGQPLRIGEGLRLYHRPSGYQLSHGASTREDLLRFAAALDELPIDWGTITPENRTPEQVEMFNKAYWAVYSDYPEKPEWAWPSMGDDGSTSPETLLVDLLDAAESHAGLSAEMIALRDKIAAFDRKLANQVWLHMTSLYSLAEIAVHGYTYSLGVLQQLAPRAAHRAARHLSVAEHNDGLGEILAGWNRQLGAGERMTLSGFPDLRGGEQAVAVPVAEPTPAQSGASRRAEVELEQVMVERDQREELLDTMTEAVAALLGTDFGEHSSANDPWRNALTALREATR